MRVDRLLQHSQAILEIDRPEGLAPFREGIAAPNIIDEDVETLMPALDPGDEFLDLCRNLVIDLDGNPLAAGCRDQFSGFFDGFALAGFVRTSSPILS